LTDSDWFHTSSKKLKNLPKLFLVTVVGLPSCVGPISDNLDTKYRAAWIADHSTNPPYSGVTNKATRNDFINDYIAIKNLQYHNYVSALRRGTSWGGFGTDVVKIALDSVAALTGTASTKAVLAGTSAGITGSTASFNKNVLFDQSIPVFVAKMDALRAAQLALITPKFDQSLAVYPVSEAFRDVEEYGHLGTIDAALKDITAKAGVEKANADQQLNDAVAARR
jgi:hypothetical protein